MSSSEEDNGHLADCVYEVPLQGKEKQEQKPSNRFLLDEHKQYDYKSLKVSTAFRNHVSKHLEALMDQTKFVEKKKKKKKLKKTEKDVISNGVTLLSSSKKCLLITDGNNEQHVKANKSKRKIKEWDEESEFKKAKEVAVTAEYVLSKAEVKSWAPENKGTVEIVKYISKK